VRSLPHGADDGFAGCFVAWRSRTPGVGVAWAPTLGLRLDLRVDGLGRPVRAPGDGHRGSVFAYGAAYLPWHLAHDGRPQAESRRFWPWMAHTVGFREAVVASVFYVGDGVVFGLIAGLD
jgi:hypothetical protein